MKATDRQLKDISEELTSYIIKPTFNLCLSPDECIILNELISEEFERRQEQDVMGSSNGQDTPVGQSGSDNTDVTLDASECRDNEASGTSLREKKKPQITKVSKKEYWDNMDKHGTYIETYFETCDMTDQPEVPYLGFMPYPDEHIPVAWMHEKVQQNFMLKSLFYSILSDWDFEADKYEAKGMNLVLHPKWLYIPLPYIVEKAKDPISNSRYRAIIQFWKQDRYMWIENRPEPKPYIPKPPTPLWDEEWDAPYGERNKVTTNATTNETSDYPVGSFGYERECLANEVEDILEKNGINPNEKTEEKIWKIPPILQAIIKDVHFVLCTETTEEYKDIFEVGKIYPTRGNNNGIHIIGIAGHGDPYDLLCHTWGDENGCAHHPAELGDELPPTFIPLESLDLGTFQFPIDT